MKSNGRIARLDAVVEFVGGGTPSRAVAEYYDGTIPWVTPKDMKHFEIVDAQEHISERAILESAASIIPLGAVLVVVRSGVLKHTLPIAVSRVPVAINQDLKALKCGPEILPDYLARFLQAQAPRILGWTRATTAENIPVERLREIEVPLPPLIQQRRIADLLASAEAVQRNSTVSLFLADQFLGSAFVHMFGDPSGNTMGWPLQTMAEAITGIEAGESVSGEDREPTDDEWSVLKISAVTTGNYLPDECKVVTALPDHPVVPSKGDLLFSRANTRELVAATCIVDRPSPRVFLPDKLWRITPVASIATREYLRYLIANPRFRLQLTRNATGTSGSMLNVSQAKLLALRIPVPPLAVQVRFASIVWSVYHMRRDLRISETHGRNLISSLSYQAFGRDSGLNTSAEKQRNSA